MSASRHSRRSRPAAARHPRRARQNRVVDDGGARAALHRQPHLLGEKRLADAEHDDVGRFRQVGQARIADVIEHGLIFRVHRIDRAGEADGAERLDDRACRDPARSVAPTMATERGLTRASSCICGPLAVPWRKNRETSTPSEHRAGEQASRPRRSRDRIRGGSIRTSSSAGSTRRGRR